MSFSPVYLERVHIEYSGRKIAPKLYWDSKVPLRYLTSTVAPLPFSVITVGGGPLVSVAVYEPVVLTHFAPAFLLSNHDSEDRSKALSFEHFASPHCSPPVDPAGQQNPAGHLPEQDAVVRASPKVLPTEPAGHRCFIPLAQ